MNRDVICRLRILVDTLPPFIRNSYLLFFIARLIFRLPNQLFTFREKYNNGKIINLEELYLIDSPFYLKRSSLDTDINSKHFHLISNLFSNSYVNSFLDV